MECSGSVSGALDWGSKGCKLETHCRRSNCVVFLSKTLYLLHSTGSTQEDTSQHDLKNCLLRSKASNEAKKNLVLRSVIVSNILSSFLASYDKTADKLCKQFGIVFLKTLFEIVDFEKSQ